MRPPSVTPPASNHDALAGSLGGDDSLELPEFDQPPPDPITLAQSWVAGALERGLREPLAAALATADIEGRPSNRVLLLKAIDADGVVFYGQRDSGKGRDLAANPYSSAVLYWRETIQQLRFDGRVEELDDDASDALFASRLRPAQAAATASAQSRPLDGDAELRARFDAVIAGEDPICRPAGWVAWRIVPASIEFWHGNRDRLHRRLRYDRAADGWTAGRLQP